MSKFSIVLLFLASVQFGFICGYVVAGKDVVRVQQVELLK